MIYCYNWGMAKGGYNLLIFNDVTKIVLWSKYPTSNLYYMEVYKIKQILKERQFDPYADIVLWL